MIIGSSKQGRPEIGLGLFRIIYVNKHYRFSVEDQYSRPVSGYSNRQAIFGFYFCLNGFTEGRGSVLIPIQRF
jgi:hypothetical protein